MGNLCGDVAKIRARTPHRWRHARPIASQPGGNGGLRPPAETARFLLISRDVSGKEPIVTHFKPFIIALGLSIVGLVALAPADAFARGGGGFHGGGGSHGGGHHH